MRSVFRRRFCRVGTILIALVLLSLVLIRWNLPELLTAVINRQLDSIGFEEAVVTVSEVNRKRLVIRDAILSRSGWKMELGEMVTEYNLFDLVNQKVTDSIELKDLHVFVDLPVVLAGDSDFVFTPELLRNIPSKEIVIAESELLMELGSSTLDMVWNAQISADFPDPEVISMEIASLQVDLTSPHSGAQLSLPKLGEPTGHLRANFYPGSDTDDRPWSGDVHWNLDQFQVWGNGWQIQESSLAGDMKFDNLNIDTIDLGDKQALIEFLAQSISGSITATTNQLMVGPLTGQWIFAELKLNEEAAHSLQTGELAPFPMLLNNQLIASIGNLQVEGESIDQVAVTISNEGDFSRLGTKGELKFLYEGIDGHANFNQTTLDLFGDLSCDGEYTVGPLAFDYFDAVGRHVENLKDLSLSGILTATGDYAICSEKRDASALVAFKDGSISMPSKNVSISGIQTSLYMNSLAKCTSIPEHSFLSIDRISLGDLNFDETRVGLDFQESNTVYVSGARTHLFGGQLTLPPISLCWNPLSFDGQLRFDRISLDSITTVMSFFDGSMEGVVSGYLPLAYSDDQIQLREGLLELPEGEIARLQYNTQGMFESKGSEKPNFLRGFLEKLTGQEKLEPGSLVEKAFSDLTINELRMELMPKDSPQTPIRIHLVGEGSMGETKLPLNLDTNINGTVDELFDFLININTLGSLSVD